MKEKETRLVGTSGAARLAACSEAAIRVAANRGDLRALRTEGGFRVFSVDDVVRYAEERASERERRGR